MSHPFLLLIMALLYCTTKLAKLFSPDEFVLPDISLSSQLGDWNGHLFHIDKRKCLIFINNITYYSLYITDVLKKDMDDFQQLFLFRLLEQMRFDLKISAEQAITIEREFSKINLAKTNNDKRVLGIINDRSYIFKVHCQEKYGSLHKMPVRLENGYLNDYPVNGSKSWAKTIFPKESMKQLILNCDPR